MGSVDLFQWKIIFDKRSENIRRLIEKSIAAYNSGNLELSKTLNEELENARVCEHGISSNCVDCDKLCEDWIEEVDGADE